MSEQTWPAFPCQRRIDTEDSVEFDTTIVRTVNGLEQRTSWTETPIKRIGVIVLARSEVPAPAPMQGYNEVEAVEKFFADHRGAFDSFYFNDKGTTRQVRFASDRLGGTWVTDTWRMYRLEFQTP